MEDTICLCVLSYQECPCDTWIMDYQLYDLLFH